MDRNDLVLILMCENIVSDLGLRLSIEIQGLQALDGKMH